MRLLDQAVLRAAAWPIETVDPFAAPALADAARLVSAAEATVVGRREATTLALHGAVPQLVAAGARAYLLAVKRHVHGCTEPLPAPAPDVQQAIAALPGLAALLAEEDAARAVLAELRAAFVSLYDAELDRQRRALWEATGEPRFGKALSIANPTVAELRRRLPSPGKGRTAKERRLEATLFHYLMRAAGRPAPNGVWAGVAPVAPSSDGEGLQVTSAPARYHATPNLQPFALMLRHLATSERCRRGFPLRLNPTFVRDDAGLCYEQRTAAGHTWRRLPAHPLHDAIARIFREAGACSDEALLEALAPADRTAPELRTRLGAAIGALIEQGLLEPALRLPPAAGDVWTALAAAIGQLVEPERGRWSAVVARIRALCGRLGEQFEQLTPEEVDALRRQIEAEVHALWQACGLPGRYTGTVVYVDLRLPFAAGWSAAYRAAASETAQALIDFHTADGAAEYYRQLSLEPLLRACAVSTETPLLPLLAAAGHDTSATRLSDQVHDEADEANEAEAADRFDAIERLFARFAIGEAQQVEISAYARAWEAALEPFHANAAHVMPPTPRPLPGSGRALPGPAGALLLPLAGVTPNRLGPGRPQPGLFVSRFAGVLQNGDGTEPKVVGRLREALAGRDRFTAAEVVGDDPLSPNAALRPALAPALLDPHGPPRDSLDHVRVCFDGAGRPWLLDADGALKLPVYNSGAAIGLSDPCSALLLSMAFGHGWELLSFGFPALSAELSRWGHRPRLLLPEGRVLSPERWTLDGDTVALLAAMSGAERYLAWRAEAEQLGLPALVHCRRGPGTPELLLRTDSPLAVRCLFDTVAAVAPWFVCSELPGDPTDWPVRDAEGRHYLAELGVTWVADAYGPQPATQTETAQQTEPGEQTRTKPIRRRGVVQRRRLALVSERRIGRALLRDLLPAGGRGEHGLPGCLQVNCTLIAAGADGTGDSSGQLWQELFASMEQWRRERCFRQFFFMRKPPGLRLRFLGGALSERLEPALVGWLEDAERRGLIRGFRFAVYEPEQFRFGGPAGMAIAHARFDADSRLALRYEALDDADRATLPRDLFSLVQTNDLFVRCVEDGAEVWDIWQRLSAAVGATVSAPRDADLRRERDALYGTPAFTRGLTPRALSLLQDAQVANADTAARLHAAFAALRLTVGMRGLLADLTIFHWNRLGFTTADLRPLTGCMLRLLDPDGAVG